MLTRTQIDQLRDDYKGICCRMEHLAAMGDRNKAFTRHFDNAVRALGHAANHLDKIAVEHRLSFEQDD